MGNVSYPSYTFHLGTPVQNSPKELMSLLCFLMPLFDSKTKSKGGFDSDDEKGGDGGERMLEHFVHFEAAEGDDYLLHSFCVGRKAMCSVKSCHQKHQK